MTNLILVNKLKYLPVPVNEYGSHVKQLHANKNRLFDRQFEVSLHIILCNGKIMMILMCYGILKLN